jgi:hypothetical protein
MKQTISVFIFTIAISVSCKKDTPLAVAKATPPHTASLSYLPLAVGNYWVYAVYSQDSSGNDTFLKYDSIYVKNDTTISGNIFHCAYDTAGANGNYGLSILFPFGGPLRDSSGYIILPPGYSMVFGRKEVDPVHLNDTIAIDTASYGVIRYWVPTSFTNDTVPAGNFSGVAMNIKEYFLGTHPHPFLGNVTYAHYSQGVGLCYYKCGFATGGRDGYVWKLLRYHV